MKDALRGMHISAISADTDKEFHRELISAVARSAGFTWELEHESRKSFRPQLTFDQFFSRAGEKYDLICGKALSNAKRAGMGFSFPHTFLDASLVATKLAAIRKTPFSQRLLLFLSPFLPDLWYTLFATTIATGILYFAVEGHGNNIEMDRAQPWYLRIANTMYLSLKMFTNHEGYIPRTGPGKLITLSFSFTVLVAISAYSANLTAFLVVQSDRLDGCKSMEECIAWGNRVCVGSGSAVESTIMNKFPHLDPKGQIVRVELNSEYTSLRNGECELVVTQRLHAKHSQLDKELNPDCKLKRVGDPVLRVAAGWLGKIDYSRRCTSLLFDSLRFHLLALDASGEYQDIEQRLQDRKATRQPCGADADEVEDGEMALGVGELVGILLVHACSAILAVVVFGIRKRTGFKTSVEEFDRGGDGASYIRPSDASKPSKREFDAKPADASQEIIGSRLDNLEALLGSHTSDEVKSKLDNLEFMVSQLVFSQRKVMGI